MNTRQDRIEEAAQWGAAYALDNFSRENRGDMTRAQMLDVVKGTSQRRFPEPTPPPSGDVEAQLRACPDPKGELTNAWYRYLADQEYKKVASEAARESSPEHAERVAGGGVEALARKFNDLSPEAWLTPEEMGKHMGHMRRIARAVLARESSPEHVARVAAEYVAKRHVMSSGKWPDAQRKAVEEEVSRAVAKALASLPGGSDAADEQVQREREAFEAYMRESQGLKDASFSRDRDGWYMAHTVELRWRGWLARAEGEPR